MSPKSVKLSFPCATLGALSLFVLLAGCSLPAPDGGSRGKYDSRTGGYSSSAYINGAIIDSVNSTNSMIEISLSEQRARLFKSSGGRKELAIETPVSTGMRGKETPSGNFHILEKLPTKDSSLYGIWVDGATGALLEKDGDSRAAPGGGRSEFQGSPMPYWLKVTPDGVGMHVGYVARHPISHGCIRVPRTAQALIYEKVSVGTPVTITL